MFFYSQRLAEGGAGEGAGTHSGAQIAVVIWVLSVFCLLYRVSSRRSSEAFIVLFDLLFFIESEGGFFGVSSILQAFV